MSLPQVLSMNEVPVYLVNNNMRHATDTPPKRTISSHRGKATGTTARPGVGAMGYLGTVCTLQVQPVAYRAIRSAISLLQSMAAVTGAMFCSSPLVDCRLFLALFLFVPLSLPLAAPLLSLVVPGTHGLLGRS